MDERPRRRMTARARALIASAGSLVVLVAVALLLPVPYVKMAPGPTFDVIGEKDGVPVLVIEGTETFPTTGSLYMTTVLESGGPRGGLTFVEALGSWLNPNDAVLPRELVYPDDVSGEEVRSRQAVLFNSAESDAIAAAMSFLERPVTSEVIVTSVVVDSPADGVIEPDDRVRSVDGTPITTPAQLRDAIRAKPVGTSFAIELDRLVDAERRTLTVDVASAANPEADGQPFIGVSVGTRVDPGFDIDFTLQNIGGPSAGLMFSLGLVDKLSSEDLAKGRQIAGTGTIDPEGNVGPIGGIRQKLAGARASGAELFLVPSEHCEEIDGKVPEGLAIASVDTLDDAVDAVRTWTSGKAPAGCAPISARGSSAN